VGAGGALEFSRIYSISACSYFIMALYKAVCESARVSRLSIVSRCFLPRLAWNLCYICWLLGGGSFTRVVAVILLEMFVDEHQTGQHYVGGDRLWQTQPMRMSLNVQKLQRRRNMLSTVTR